MTDTDETTSETLGIHAGTCRGIVLLVASATGGFRLCSMCGESGLAVDVEPDEDAE